MQSSRLAVALALALCAALAASAYTPPVFASESAPVEVGGRGPSPQAGVESEGESELPWLFAVFFVTWAAFFGYAFVMSKRQRELKREIDALVRALALRDAEKDETKPEDTPIA